jgi:tetraacyldisaccharide 4'-kinase
MIDLLNPYAWIMRLRRWLYRIGVLRSVSIGVPVISVGNLSVGGTGKTPFTLHLVRRIQDRFGLRCAVVLRGYKRESSGLLVVRDWDAVKVNARRSGDEAQLYARGLSNALVICDEDRVNGARMAREMGAEVIVLDDGFQHMRLRRNLNILLVNALEGLPKVIPFGRGREVPSAASAADLIFVTNSILSQESLGETLRTTANAPVIATQTRITSLRPIGRPDDDVSMNINGKTVLAVSGIGMPQGFESSLASMCEKVVSLRFSDHSRYDAATIASIEAAAISSGCQAIVTTTKDEVKLVELLSVRTSQIPFYVAQSQIDLGSDETILLTQLDALLGPASR